MITPQEAESVLAALPRLFPGLVLRVTSNAWQDVIEFRSDHGEGIASRLQERMSEVERRQATILKSLSQGGGAAASHLRKSMEQQPVLVTAELDWPTPGLDLSTLPVSIYLADADIHQ